MLKNDYLTCSFFYFDTLSLNIRLTVFAYILLSENTDRVDQIVIGTAIKKKHMLNKKYTF